MNTHIRALIYVCRITHIWVHVYDNTYMSSRIWVLDNTYMSARIWLHIYEYTYMSISCAGIGCTHIWVQVYDPIYVYSKYTYMSQLNDPMSADIWSYTRVYGLHVYDPYTCIWYPYMSIHVYDTHIWVRFPLWWTPWRIGMAVPKQAFYTDPLRANRLGHH